MKKPNHWLIFCGLLISFSCAQDVKAEQALTNNNLDLATDRLTTKKQAQVTKQTVAGAENLFNPVDQTNIKIYQKAKRKQLKQQSATFFVKGQTKTDTKLPQTTQLNVASEAAQNNNVSHTNATKQTGGAVLVTAVSGASLVLGGGASMFMRRRD